MNNYFKFKQFTVFQGKTAMKVGVDGVLLGAWTNTTDAKTILDIGTGSGLLSLMLAQKSSAQITAIDIDEDSFIQAKLNFENSLWNNRISIRHLSFQDFYKNSSSKFNIIICNPPYFIKSLKSVDNKRNIARHDELLPLETLFYGVSQLLSEKGRFFIIYPFGQRDHLIFHSNKNKLYPARELIIRGTATKSPNRIIVEYSSQNQACLSEELVVRDHINNDYTGGYKELTSDYYLAF